MNKINKFLRTIQEKNEYDWDVLKAQIMIDVEKDTELLEDIMGDAYDDPKAKKIFLKELEKRLDKAFK